MHGCIYPYAKFVAYKTSLPVQYQLCRYCTVMAKVCNKGMMCHKKDCSLRIFPVRKFSRVQISWYKISYKWMMYENFPHNIMEWFHTSTEKDEFERACCIQGYDGPLGSSWQAIQVATNPSLSFTRMNISNCKNFVVLIVCCRKYFECLIFVLYLAYENILAPKIFQTTVLSPFHAWHWSLHNIFNILQLAGAHSVRIQFHHQIPSASGTRTRPA